MAKLRDPKLIIVLVITVVLLIIPQIAEPFIVHIIIWIFFYSVLCGTFRFVSMTGDWTFAHVPLMGVGAYTSALLTLNLGWPVLPTMIVAGISATIVGLPVYAMSLKTRAVTFFWVTWVIGEVVRQVFSRFQFFGGHAGIPGIPSPSVTIPGLFRVEFLTQVPYYYLGMGLMTVIFLFMYLVEQSRIGRTMKSINENMQLADALGINVWWYRMLALIIGTFFVGINGAFYAHWVHYLSPLDFAISFGLLVLLYVIVGGHRTWWGPILGVVVFVLLSQVVRPLQEYSMALYGFILVLVCIRFRAGLEDIVMRLTRKTMTIFAR